MTHIAGEVLQVAEARSEGFCILTKSGRVVVGSEDEYGNFGPIKNHDDSRRIVACVNACDGWEIIQLEAMEHGSLKESLVRVMQQRDDLLAALKCLLPWAEGIGCVHPGVEYTGDHPLAVARAVINKITGETK